jgi:hypothetical protein
MKAIKFNDEMVRAIIEGKKTQTRRPVKPQPPQGTAYVIADEDPSGLGSLCIADKEGGRFADGVDPWRKCPYGKVGDRLWVQEAFTVAAVECVGGWIMTTNPIIPIPKDNDGPWVPVHRATHSTMYTDWHPPQQMPKWASRITLEITAVRVERVQGISAEDAIAEGGPPSHESFNKVSRSFGYKDFPRSWFAQLWDSIYGGKEFAWANNPWVWVIQFEVVK